MKEFYYEMLRIRRIEEAIAHLYPEQKMRCPVHLSIGQEAVAVGVCQALEKSDRIISAHRAHAHYLAKGGNLKRMIAEIYGKESGCCGGRGGSMHLVDLDVGMMGSTPIVGGSIPVGVGLAFSDMLNNSSKITVIFFGEGATEEGVWAESINFAALHRLSVLFLCENNLYSVYSPMNVRQPSERDRCMIARSHGLLADKGDGNIVEEVFDKTRHAVKYIREKKGPAFLEFSTYRHREHCGPFTDNHIGYRTQEEASFWGKRCPIERWREQYGTLELEDKISKEIADAFQFAEESSFPRCDL